MTTPKITKLGDNITCVGAKVRVEAGPRLVAAVATEALLSDDATAGHYAVGRRDALGNEIVLGEPMHYLAWGGKLTPGETSFYVYQLTPRPVTGEDGETTLVDDPDHWVTVDAHDTVEAAMAQAGALAAAT